MEKWMEDIQVAIETAKTSNGPSSDLLTSSLTDNSKLLHTHTVAHKMYTWKLNCGLTVTVRKYILSKKNPTWDYVWMIWHCLCFSALLPSPPYPLPSSNNLLTFPECPEDSVEAESEDDLTSSHTSLDRPHRGNTMVHVCWHRNTSVSMVDFSIAVEVPAKPQTCSSPPASLFSLSVSECALYFNSLWLSLGGNSILLHCTPLS